MRSSWPFRVPLLGSLALAFGLLGLASGAPLIVENGETKAEIVIADAPPRMVELAARELQAHLEKISGARLPIVRETGTEGRLHLFVGRSRGTDALGVDDEGLRHGAYRQVSGPDFLVLLGHDFDFAPIEPWSHDRKDAERAEKEWDRLTAERTDTAWGFPMTSLYRSFNLPTQTWAHDEGGSLQAVYGFLRSLGVRWYLPGELGEVIPKRPTIALPEGLDETVHPDFPLRHYLGPAYFNAPEEAVLWGRRLGLNSGFELLGIGPKTHGLSRVHERSEMQQTHPDYYALVGGKRDLTTKGSGHACWSSPGLQREAVAYARTLFDHYGEPTLQLSPQDGLRLCQCENCAPLTASDAVWGFLDRVARETMQTHPDRYLVGAAYTFYREPPASIERLSPNLIVRINNVGRPQFRDPEHWQWYRELVDGWREKTASGKIIRVENNYYDTVIHPRSIARDLRAMKGISLGEMSEVTRENVASGPGQTWGRPGTNHLNLYVNARFFWDADHGIEAVLTEYYDGFYGPASEAMRAAFDFAESAYSVDGKAHLELSARVRLLELLHEARAVAGDSIYGRRIQMIIDEFDPLEELRRKLESTGKRGDDLPTFEPWNLTSGKWDQDRATARIDGKLEERFWNLRGKLRPSGDDAEASPGPPVRFQVLHANDALWVGIRCPEGASSGPSGEGGSTHDDEAILADDRVEILLETDVHAYYRIVVSPTGAIYDSDREEGDGEEEAGRRWDSNAEVAVHHENGAWSIEARIPLVPEGEGAGDPLHHVLFRRPPSNLWPWHFNLVRVRKSGDVTEVTAFAPVAEEQILDRFTFGKLAR